MSKRLYLQLAAADGGAVRWLDPLRGSEESGTLTLACAADPGIDAVVLVPGEMVLISRAGLPKQNRQRLLRAVPYALEEQLLDDVDDLHFALPMKIDADKFPVLVVKREQMEQWQEDLKRVGIRAGWMLPEALALDWQPGNWRVHLQGEKAIVRTAADRGLSVERDLLESVLSLALQQQDTAPQSIVISGEIDDSLQAQEELLGVPLEFTAADKSPLRDAAELDLNQAVNLLQGDYSATERMGKMLRPWIPASVAAGLLLVVYLAGVGIQGSRLDEQSDALFEQSVKVYQDTFPGARATRDPRRFMERRLKQLEQGDGGDGILAVMAKAAPVLKGEKGARVRNLIYRNDRLDMEMDIRSLEALDQLKGRLVKATQLSVDILSARSAPKGVDARIRITRSGQ